MSARSTYRRKRRQSPPDALTPFADELGDRPVVKWAAFVGWILVAAYVAFYLVYMGGAA